MKKIIFLLSTILTIIISLGCQLGESNQQDDVAQHDESPVVGERFELSNDIEGTITVLSFYPEIKEIEDRFREKYPHIELLFDIVDFGDLPEIYLQRLLSENTPDVMIIENTFYGQVSGISGFENLLDFPYDAARYKKDMLPMAWDRFLLENGTKMIALPVDIPPGVIFYREDILEEHGFPADPNQLGEYIQDPDNWFEMAHTLKENDHWVLQWNHEIVEMITRGYGFFDQDLQYIRNNKELERSFELAMRAHQEGIASYINMWGNEGRQALNNGKLAMVHLGSWGDVTLQTLAPHTEGKWRVTRLPFGFYGSHGGSAISITSSSQNKLAAWAFVDHFLTNVEESSSSVPVYGPAREALLEIGYENPFLGGQNPYPLFVELLEKLPPIEDTPLDGRAAEVWNNNITSYIESGLEPAEILEKLEEKILINVYSERELLLRMKE